MGTEALVVADAEYREDWVTVFVKGVGVNAKMKQRPVLESVIWCVLSWSGMSSII